MKIATASSEVFVIVKFTVRGEGQPQKQLQGCGVCMPESSSIMREGTADSKGRLQVHVLLTSIKQVLYTDSQLGSVHLHVLAGSAFQRFVSDFGKLGTVIGMCSRNNGRSKHHVSIVLEWPSC